MHSLPVFLTVRLLDESSFCHLDFFLFLPAGLCFCYDHLVSLPLTVCVSISTVYFSFVSVGNCSLLFIDAQQWRQTSLHIKHPPAITVVSC